MVDCIGSIKTEAMKYEDKYYLKSFIHNLPTYMSLEDKNQLKFVSLKILQEIDDLVITNALIVGQVQSGKTNVIIGLTALAIDNDYDLIIVFGGVNRLLLQQTFDRLKTPLISDSYKGVFIVDKDKLKNPKEIDSYSRLLSTGKTKIIIITMKESRNMLNLKAFLENVYLSKLKVLIIDDEADNATLNVGKNNQPSRIYQEFINIKGLICSGVYIGVTATPYGNLISEKSQDMYPQKIYELKPSKMYTGLDFFNSNKEKIYNIVKETKKSEDWSNAIKKSFACFLVNSFVMNQIEKKRIPHEFLINIELNIKSITLIKIIAVRFLKKLNTLIGNGNAFFDINEIKNAIHEWKICKIWKYDFDTKFIKYVEEYLRYANDRILILADENKEYNSVQEGLQVIIGGTLISRGFTFNNLLVELILNSPEENIPADTLLQRARWFGYRYTHNRYKYMKIFMSENIHEAFSKVVCLQNTLFTYIEKCNTKQLNLSCDTAQEVFSELELIIPSRK